jgi:DNA-binding GntR family transcriptional regulator
MRQVALSRTDELMAVLDANIEAQAGALAAGDLQHFYELDEGLHEHIFGAIGHPRAQHLLDSARAQLDRVRRLALPSEGRPEATLNEHRRLVEAVRMSDPDFAAAAMRAHLTAVAEAVELQLSRASGGPDRG